MSRLILIGAGGFAREVLEWASDTNEITANHLITHYLDDKHADLKSFGYNLDFLGDITNFKPEKSDRFLLGVGSPEAKRNILKKFAGYKAQFQTLIHPTAVITRTSNIGVGTIVCPFSVLSANTRIGNFVTLNCYTSIGHDAVIGDFSTLSSHVDITGAVQIGESCFLGSGARVVPKKKIGNRVNIGAGCTIQSSIKGSGTYYTAPAKKLF
ncbi:acetyltransferase [Pseudidiomarina aquimaris]|uniref:Acetyltransferase n=1 Tax=Pseudidiomarina aquimaris TaxID=641841 RepID=A0A432XD05_9GAMM|nr:acetyltransferase [Pseudidiomarina aquimaris]RUO46613.1 acetyltransferase [Pseudidiomarina aquimaris]